MISLRQLIAFKTGTVYSFRLFGILLDGVLIPQIGHIIAAADRKECAIGMTNLLTACNAMLSDAYFPVWPKLLNALIEMMESKAEIFPAVANDDDIDFDDAEEKGGYQASFARLATVGGNVTRKLPSADPPLYLAEALGKLSQTHPHKVGQVILQQLPQETASRLTTYMQIAGVSLIR